MPPALPFRRSVLALGLLAVTVFSAITAGFLFGLPSALLWFAGSALVLIIALLWSSVQSLAGQTPLTLDEALSLGAPSAEEEQKRAVLRALKDLEYERSVGKIGEDDYAELSTRYRAEARRLIAALDESSAPARALAEKLAAERLAKADGAATATADKDATRSPESEPSPSSAGEQRCADCGTPNDADAVFCKRCGATLANAAGPVERSARRAADADDQENSP